MIVTYQPGSIEATWDEIAPFIEKALDRGSTWNIQEVYEGLLDARFQCWTWQNPDIQAVLITYVLDGSCALLAISGKNMAAWLSGLAYIEGWAKSVGCEKMAVHGRKGWSRVLGYGITGKDELGLDVMEKRL